MMSMIESLFYSGIDSFYSVTSTVIITMNILGALAVSLLTIKELFFKTPLNRLHKESKDE